MKWKATDRRKTMYEPDTPMRITIHRYVGCGDELYLTCHDLKIEDVGLDTDKLDDAIVAARQIIERKSAALSAKVSVFLKDNNDVIGG